MKQLKLTFSQHFDRKYLSKLCANTELPLFFKVKLFVTHMIFFGNGLIDVINVLLLTKVSQP